MREYYEAIRRAVCIHCIDALPSPPGAGCTLVRRRDCPVHRFLPQLVSITHSLRSDFAEDYRAMVRAQVCAICPHSQDSDCPLRARADCPLDRYLVLVIDAIDHVDEAVAS